MLENSYSFYCDYLKKRNIKDKSILISKTRNSYLIGPIINSKFDERSFYKRIKSNSIYGVNIYKKMFNRKCLLLINRYANSLKDNQIMEIYKNGDIVLHSILKVPGENDEDGRNAFVRGRHRVRGHARIVKAVVLLQRQKTPYQLLQTKRTRRLGKDNFAAYGRQKRRAHHRRGYAVRQRSGRDTRVGM